MIDATVVKEVRPEVPERPDTCVVSHLWNGKVWCLIDHFEDGCDYSSMATVEEYCQGTLSQTPHAIIRIPGTRRAKNDAERAGLDSKLHNELEALESVLRLQCSTAALEKYVRSVLSIKSEIDALDAAWEKAHGKD